jgi:hypothetical protein
MAIEDKRFEGLDREEKALLNKLDELGGRAGNITLVGELGWEKDRYWEVRDRLEDAGRLERAKGKGGSVRLIKEVDDERADTSIPPKGQGPDRETDLYAPMAEVLKGDWSKDQRFDRSVVEITARQGRRDTGGTWTRPDITLVGLSTFQVLPGTHLDIVTFEIKPSWGLNVTAVYEALAHRRAAHRAFLLIHVPEDQLEEELMKTTLGSIYEEAERHGVGVIIATDPWNFGSWETHVDAAPVNSPPHSMNDFLTVQLSEEKKAQIREWLT